MDPFEEVSDWLDGSTVTPKQENVNLVTTESSTQYTTMIAEPVTSPFSLETADFLLTNSEQNNNKNTIHEGRVLLGQNNSIPLINQDGKSPPEWNTPHLTVNTSKQGIFSILININARKYAIGLIL